MTVKVFFFTSIKNVIKFLLVPISGLRVNSLVLILLSTRRAKFDHKMKITTNAL